MVDLGEQKANSVAASRAETMDSNDLREERKRNGRYVATIAALFGLVLGIYHFLAQGTPQYAAIFLPAVIMFVYIFWILNVSKRSRKINKEALLMAEQATSEISLNEVKIVPSQQTESIPKSSLSSASSSPTIMKNSEDELIDDTISEDQPEKHQHKFCRTYSIA